MGLQWVPPVCVAICNGLGATFRGLLFSQFPNFHIKSLAVLVQRCCAPAAGRKLSGQFFRAGFWMSDSRVSGFDFWGFLAGPILEPL